MAKEIFERYDITVRAMDMYNAIRNMSKFTSSAERAGLSGMVHFVIRRNRLVAEATDRARYIQIDVGLVDLPNGHEPVTLGTYDIGAFRVFERGLVDLKRSLTTLNVLFRTFLGLPASMEVESVVGVEPHTFQATGYDFPNLDRNFPKLYDCAEAGGDMKAFDPILLRSLGDFFDTRLVRSAQDIRLINTPGYEPLVIHWVSDHIVWAQGLLSPVLLEEIGTFETRVF